MSERCAFEGCPRRAQTRGWCDRHYRRVLHHGTVDTVGRIDRDLDDQRSRLTRGLAEVHDPVALAHSYLARHQLLGGRDTADLLDVALESIVDAAIAWEPAGGRSMVSWAWVYMDRNVKRELARCVERRQQLGEHACVSDSWLRYDPSIDPYDQIELRVDLQRWADLAELTPLMRWLVQYAALHLGTVVRYTRYQTMRSPLKGSTHVTLQLALKHMRQAAITGQRRDDAWTRMRNRADRDQQQARKLAELHELEDQLDALALDPAGEELAEEIA